MKAPLLVVVLLLGAMAAPPLAEAQFRRSDPATGETYHVELSYGWWNPTPVITVSSEGFGIPGTLVDFTTDLGIEKKRLSEFRAVLRPARKHKFKLDYIPIGYEIEGHTLTRPIIFNGQQFTVGLPVNVTADWKTWRIGYEYDFIYRDRGYFGIIAEVKYTKASIDFASPLTVEFAETEAPIPALGFAGRGYLARNVSATGEFTFFRLRNAEEDSRKGRYYDYDLYATVNFSDNVGVIGGWRKLDLDYTVDFDFGSLDMKGYYFMGVVRF
jgi:hypothetical protein